MPAVSGKGPLQPDETCSCSLFPPVLSDLQEGVAGRIGEALQAAGTPVQGLCSSLFCWVTYS